MINQREKERLSKNAKRHIETEEECAEHKKTYSDCMSRKRQSETVEQGVKGKMTARDCKMRTRQTETDKQHTKCKKTDWNCWRRNREDKRHQSQNDSKYWHGEDMANVINRATKEATQFLFRTQDPSNPHKHRATGCIICDCFIIGIETIHKLTKEDILAHSKRLGLKSYEEFYETTLKAEAKKQYEVHGLQDMLLSPGSRKYPDGYATCSYVTPECSHRWH